MNAQQFLTNNLFLTQPPLAAAILQLRREYTKFIEMSFVDVSSINENINLFYFIEAQMVTFERARDALVKYRNDMTGILCTQFFSFYFLFKNYADC